MEVEWLVTGCLLNNEKILDGKGKEEEEGKEESDDDEDEETAFLKIHKVCVSYTYFMFLQ